ncbi:hypothetical protein SLS62_007551 [Diatrype stigma]|uniref:Uncharacterized protein n=1 Tax=Diatrype stigma TaxID=117547 RepID=A0AAN9UNL9_9PEZI
MHSEAAAMAPLPPPRPPRDVGGDPHHDNNILTALIRRSPLLPGSMPSLLQGNHGGDSDNSKLQSPRGLPLSLAPRLATGVDSVPAGYGNAPSGPAPGVVAGIVLGSVAGFLLVLWLIYWCVNLGYPSSATAVLETGSVSGVTTRSGGRYGASSSVVSRHSRPRPGHGGSGSRVSGISGVGGGRRSSKQQQTRTSVSRSPPGRRHRSGGGMREVFEMRRDRRRSGGNGAPPPPHPRSRSPEMDQIIVEEEHSDLSLRGAHARPPPPRGSRPPSRGPPAPPAPAPPPAPPLPPGLGGGRARPPPPQQRHHDLTSSSSEEDDEIVVLEENSTPPRQRDRRGSRSGGGRNTNTNSRRSSGSYYRDVDPHRYGSGGDGLSRRGSSSRRFS